MPRTKSRPFTSSVNSITGARDHAKSVKHISTVSTNGGPRRYLSVGGTPTLTQPTKKARARAEAQTVRRSLDRVEKAYNTRRPADSNRDGKYTPTEAVALARSVGASKDEALTLSTKLLSESGGDPKAVGDDAAAGYGNTFGLGLWQITTGVGNDDTINKYGGKQAMLKPRPNAKAALDILRSQGSGAWYGASGTPGKLVPPASKGMKPKKKDLKIVRKAGVAPKPTQPFGKAAKKASQAKNASKIINPKWDPDSDGHGETFLAKGISPVVKKWSRKFDVRVGEAKADSGHVSPGHLQTGTATDLYPMEDTEAGWDKLERGLKVLEDQGFEVGYGTNGVGQAWSNHGRYNHAHVEWVGQGSSEDAIKKLGGLTDAQISAIENSTGGSSGSSGGSPGGTSGAAPASPSTQPSSKKDKLAAAKRKLRRVQGAYDTASSSPSSLSTLERRYGSPVV